MRYCGSLDVCLVGLSRKRMFDSVGWILESIVWVHQS